MCFIFGYVIEFQVMIIVAWSPAGPLGLIFEEVVQYNAMSIFITYAFLNFIQGNLACFFS